MTTSRSYAEFFVPEAEVVLAARGRAADLGCVPIGSGGAAALTFLAATIGARSVVEIGTGAGVSGLHLMAGMAPDGILTSIDVEAEHHRAAKKAFSEAGIGPTRTRLINGRALDVLPRLTDGAYDLVFVDGAQHRIPAVRGRGAAPATAGRIAGRRRRAGRRQGGRPDAARRRDRRGPRGRPAGPRRRNAVRRDDPAG